MPTFATCLFFIISFISEYDKFLAVTALCPVIGIPSTSPFSPLNTSTTTTAKIAKIIIGFLLKKPFPPLFKFLSSFFLLSIMFLKLFYAF